MNRLALGVALLAAVYALMLASAAPLDLLTGVVLAVLVLAALRQVLFAGGGLPPGIPGLGRRALAAPAFAWIVLREVATGTWTVALVMLGLRSPDKAGLVRVPIGPRSDAGVLVTALSSTLSPGEVLVAIDWERREMLLHVMDASDPDAVRARHREIYDRHQARVVP